MVQIIYLKYLFVLTFLLCSSNGFKFIEELLQKIDKHFIGELIKKSQLFKGFFNNRFKMLLNFIFLLGVESLL